MYEKNIRNAIKELQIPQRPREKQIIIEKILLLDGIEANLSG